MFIISLFIVIFITIIVMFIIRKENYKEPILNIYGKPLQPCRDDLSDHNGSWDTEGKCSEPDGGVHQICVRFNSSTRDFAKNTYQSTNWSTKRQDKPHCVCLGAYALYAAQHPDNPLEVNCDAVPDTVFSPEYINKWSEWNGREVPDQIKKGVQLLRQTCQRLE